MKVDYVKFLLSSFVIVWSHFFFHSDVSGATAAAATEKSLIHKKVNKTSFASTMIKLLINWQKRKKKETEWNCKFFSLK